MPHATILIVGLVLFSAALIAVLVARPGIASTRGGKILAFMILFFLPILCGAIGVSSEMEHSTTTASPQEESSLLLDFGRPMLQVFCDLLH